MILQFLVACYLSFLPVGVPNISGASSASTSNYLSVKNGYLLSYNGSTGLANWVGWTLKSDDIGPIDRSNRFLQDDSFPRGFKVIDESDYKESGYDRGHLCNSEDRTASRLLNEETFLMSNMMPQTPELNRGPYKMLENYCRKLVQKKGLRLLIYAGGIGAANHIGRAGVIVPRYCWKAVYTPNESFFVLFPNVHELNKNWKTYLVSKEVLAKMTGLKFP